MVRTCCVDGCISSGDAVYFRFPNSRTQRKRWLDAITPRVTVTDNSRICSQHFLEDQYETIRGKTRLKAKVIPSVFNLDSKELEDGQKSPSRIPPEISERLDVPTTGPSEVDANKTVWDPLDHRNENRIPNGDQEPKSRIQPQHTDLLESSKDIEEIITNYHIKQIRPVEQPPDASGEIDDRQNIIEVSIDVSREIETNLIEIDVDKGKGRTNQECLMLLESVQVDVDPNLVFPDMGEEPVVDVVDVDDTKSDHDCQMMLENVEVSIDPNLFPDRAETTGESDIIEIDDKKEDPISLLTSSDEDDVILEEPKIDTVELSSENEDDVPLVKLVKKSKKPNLKDIFWGKYEYYCVECQYSTNSRSDYRKHLVVHSKIMHMCQFCKFATPSKNQLERHQKKHRYEKKYKCLLCDYSARHSMSLTYHMKCHDQNEFKCDKCNFQSSDKVKVYKHIRMCNKLMNCEFCEYQTVRKTDLKRHRIRRHREQLQEGDDYVPT